MAVFKSDNTFSVPTQFVLSIKERIKENQSFFRKSQPLAPEPFRRNTSKPGRLPAMGVST